MKKKVSILIIMIMVFNVLSGFYSKREVYATSRTPDEAINYVKSLLGQSIDADGYEGAQCVDLILKYYDYLGVARSSGNGADYTGNTLPDGWQRLQGVQPEKGDILVYTGGSGHVAIYESDRVTYHQNFANNQTVQQIGYMYNGLNNPYWGVIRPNWKSNSDTQSPVISNVKVNCNNEYALIQCDVTDNVGVSRVQAPTWPTYKSSEGCPWYEPISVNGNHYTFRLNLNDFANYRGCYMTHIYAWDAAGNCTSANAGVYDMTADYTAPVISNINVYDITSTGYTVECDVADNAGIASVQFPTWTEKNGQDDLIWKEADTFVNNHATFRVNTSEHGNEEGIYRTHIYARDNMSNMTSCVVSDILICFGVQVYNCGYFENHLYAAINQELTWNDSNTYCGMMGGHLATITSEKENEFIKNLCEGGMQNYFLGATDENIEGSWKWNTEEFFEYSRWGNTQPDNNGGNENYLEINVKGNYWNDVPNDIKRRGYIIEIDDDFKPVISGEYNGKLYEVYDVKTSWKLAKLFCQKQGGKLAVIESDEENDYLNTLCNKGIGKSHSATGYFYLGISFENKEGIWKDVDGNEVSYLNWGEYYNNTDIGMSSRTTYAAICPYPSGGEWIWSKEEQDSMTGFVLEKDICNPSIQYKTQVQSIGWEKSYVSDGKTSGTVGKAKRLEAIRIKLVDESGNTLDSSYGSVEYRTHVQKNGWEKSFVKDDALSGTVGKALRLEAIQIRLTGDIANNYDVYYRVQAEKLGWLGWAKNGEESGSAGYGYRLEAIQIKLVKKGETAPDSENNLKPFYDKTKIPVVSYKTQVQTYGWEKAFVSNGATSGTVGKAKRLEAIQIKISNNKGYSGGIKYKTHVQKLGWQNYVSDGFTSGTVGKGYRLEAIQIELTGDIVNYFDVYYRVQAQKFGWLGWAKNGISAGTAGYGYRLEAIQIQLVHKGTAAPGSTSNCFKKK
ncbi:Uncharacterized conserved protein YjdB, contains Ig-like domain [Lachnospiraceae bacterium RM5]|nr:Uncharacterized conserved protein YjdB, contains Ig-like domain [Lachnospiraceae bacterium RM5]